MLSGAFVADDKFPDVVAALEARGWRRQHAAFPRPQLRWANYARIPWTRVGDAQIVNHLQHAVAFSRKDELARRLYAYQRRLRGEGGVDARVVDEFFPRTVDLSSDGALGEVERWAAYFRALAAVKRYARRLREGGGGAEDASPSEIELVRCSVRFLEAALKDASFFEHGDEQSGIDEGAAEQSVLTALWTGDAAAGANISSTPLTAAENSDIADLLQRVLARDPQFHAVRDDGEEEDPNSVWICKPSNLSQGRGVTLIQSLKELSELVKIPPDTASTERNKTSKQQQWIVQKYIERPLLFQGGRKFDIRQWVLITALPPDARVYWYRDCYLRFCAQPFSLKADSCHDRFAHLSNYSVQKDFVAETTVGEDDEIDSSAFESMWSSHHFRNVLRQRYNRDIWELEIVPKMQNATKHILHAILPELRAVGRGFEWLGLDFLLDEALNVWLLEVNVSPDVSHSTPVTAELVPRATVDAISLVLDPIGEIAPDNAWTPLVIAL